MSQSPSQKNCCISHKYFSHCFRLLSDFPTFSKYSKFTEDIRLIDFLFMMSKLFESVTSKIAQRYTVKSKCPSETDGVTQFNRNLAAVSVFWNIDKALYTTWHSGLLQTLSKLQFPFSAVKLIWFSCQKENSLFRWKGKSPRVDFLPWHSVVVPLLFCLYPNDIPQTPVHI